MKREDLWCSVLLNNMVYSQYIGSAIAEADEAVAAYDKQFIDTAKVSTPVLSTE